jgi:hypothetical protein
LLSQLSFLQEVLDFLRIVVVAIIPQEIEVSIFLSSAFRRKMSQEP